MQVIIRLSIFSVKSTWKNLMNSVNIPHSKQCWTNILLVEFSFHNLYLAWHSYKQLTYSGWITEMRNSYCYNHFYKISVKVSKILKGQVSGRLQKPISNHRSINLKQIGLLFFFCTECFLSVCLVMLIFIVFWVTSHWEIGRL